MSSVTNNINAENHGVKIWTYPTGEVGFSIFFPIKDEMNPENYANFANRLQGQLQKHFKVITDKADQPDEPKQDMKIAISNANKDNITHVTVEGYDPTKITDVYKNALLNPSYYVDPNSTKKRLDQRMKDTKEVDNN